MASQDTVGYYDENGVYHTGVNPKYAGTARSQNRNSYTDSYGVVHTSNVPSPTGGSSAERQAGTSGDVSLTTGPPGRVDWSPGSQAWNKQQDIARSNAWPNNQYSQQTYGADLGQRSDQNLGNALNSGAYANAPIIRGQIIQELLSRPSSLLANAPSVATQTGWRQMTADAEKTRKKQR